MPYGKIDFNHIAGVKGALVVTRLVLSRLRGGDGARIRTVPDRPRVASYPVDSPPDLPRIEFTAGHQRFAGVPQSVDVLEDQPDGP